MHLEPKNTQAITEIKANSNKMEAKAFKITEFNEMNILVDPLWVWYDGLPLLYWPNAHMILLFEPVSTTSSSSVFGSTFKKFLLKVASAV